MSKKGVTILEIIIVMVIIAIAAALTIPNIGAWIPTYRLRTATRDIVSLMRSAQMRAISENVEYRVRFVAADGSFVLQRRTTTGVWMDEGVAQRVPSGIRFHEVNLPNNCAEFNPNATSSAGNVILRNRKENQKRIVVFSATGRIRIE
jgi:prepilin-type N-terminal cleavage/methylation domain-containing protein